MSIEQVSTLTGVTAVVGGLAIGVVRWMLGRERERNDATYQTQRDAHAVLVEIREALARVEEKVSILLNGRSPRGRDNR